MDLDGQAAVMRGEKADHIQRLRYIKICAVVVAKLDYATDGLVLRKRGLEGGYLVKLTSDKIEPFLQLGVDGVGQKVHTHSLSHRLLGQVQQIFINAAVTAVDQVTDQKFHKPYLLFI